MCLDHRDPAHLASQVLRLLDIHDSHHKPAESLWERGILIDLHSMHEILGTFKGRNPSRDCMSEILPCGWFAQFRQSGVLSLSFRIKKPAITCQRNHRRALWRGNG